MSFIRSLFSVYFSRSTLNVSRLGPSRLALFPFTVCTLCFSISSILALEFRFAELYYRLALPFFRSVPYCTVTFILVLSCQQTHPHIYVQHPFISIHSPTLFCTLMHPFICTYTYVCIHIYSSTHSSLHPLSLIFTCSHIKSCTLHLTR